MAHWLLLFFSAPVFLSKTQTMAAARHVVQEGGLPGIYDRAGGGGGTFNEGFRSKLRQVTERATLKTTLNQELSVMQSCLVLPQLMKILVLTVALRSFGQNPPLDFGV